MNVLLIGNYAPDEQVSMLRFAQLMLAGLHGAGVRARLVAPRRFLPGSSPDGIGKWAGYIDKLLLSPPLLRAAARRADIVHVCDHSNSMYIPSSSAVPYVVTCHDLLAVRGALGEIEDCAASATGQLLQRAIRSGLGRARAIACVSTATQLDVERLVHGFKGPIRRVPNALHHDYRRLDAETVGRRLARLGGLRDTNAYVLHVGSNQRRKNRECTLRAVAGIKSSWPGKLVLAGPPLTPELHSLAAELGITDRLVAVVRPDNAELEALYNGALATLFPSRYEGFGWPILEAQACGCPVICSDREPMREVAAGAAILCDPDDFAAFGRAVLELSSRPDRRAELARLGGENLRRYSRSLMISQYVALYEEILSARGARATA